MEDQELKWYILHTYSTYENLVKTNLEKKIENNNLQDIITEIAIPLEEDIVERNGKRKVIQRKKYPCYVFVKMRYSDDLWWEITNTKGVTGFVGPQGKAQPLPPEEVKRAGLEKVAVEDFDVALGDTVRVISGALETFVGVVDEIAPDKAKVRVIVQMFGRQTPVELEFNQIEKVN